MSTNRVRIVTDSACDLPQSVADELGIEIVPLTIRIDGQEYVDRVDLTPAEFWAKCAASPELPSTAAPAVEPPLERYRDAKASAIASFERTYLAKLIERSAGNASEAARRAQMDRPYLLALLRRYGLR